MSKSLKSQNLKVIAIFLLFNLAMFLGFLKSGEVFSGDFSFLYNDISKTIPLVITVFFVAVFNHALSPLMKFRIVFFRWNNPMPGSKAFSKYLYEDNRIDVNSLKERYPELPKLPVEQNSLWYKWLKSVENHELINGIHKSFLLFRDTSTIALMLLLILPIIALYYGVETNHLNIYIAFMTLQLLFIIVAARDRGIRLVTSVIALKSTTD